MHYNNCNTEYLIRPLHRITYPRDVRLFEPHSSAFFTQTWANMGQKFNCNTNTTNIMMYFTRISRVLSFGTVYVILVFGTNTSLLIYKSPINTDVVELLHSKVSAGCAPFRTLPPEIPPTTPSAIFRSCSRSGSTSQKLILRQLRRQRCR